MGMFSQNRTMLSEDFEVQANESYVGAAGAYRAMTEGYQNSYAVFESCIGLDFMEAAVVNEAGDISEFEIVQEGFAGDFFNKIKEFLTKLIEKIKGIVKSFIAKVTGTFCRDGKKLVDKYKADVLKKDLSKMKYKWQKVNNDVPDIKTTELSKIYKDALGAISTEDVSGYLDTVEKAGTMNPDKFIAEKEKLDDNSAMEKDLGSMCTSGGGSCELSEFSKEFHDYLYQDEEECEGFGSDGANLSEIMLDLSTGKKAISDIEKSQKTHEKDVKEYIKKVDTAQKQLMKLVPDKNGSDKRKTNITAINNRLNIAMTAANQISTVTTKYFACLLDEKKKYLARCKKVFTQAAAYRTKSANESALFVEAAGEVAEYETLELFDNVVGG